MPVAGIDYSRSYVDIVLLDEDTDQATWHRIDLRGKPDRAWDAARRTRPAMPLASFWDDVWLAGIESGYRGRVYAVRALSLIQGAILASIPPDVCVVPTPLEEWLRVFTGNPKADKAAVCTEALRRLADTDGRVRLSWPQDAFDAYGIAWAVRQLNQQAITKGAA